MPKTLVDLESLREPGLRAVTEMFETMLDLETHAVDGKTHGPDDQSLFGLVHLSGTWSGAVVLECKPHQAFVWTSKLMSVAEPDCLNDDVRDAMGELTSMLAGNFKSMMPAGTSISMPTVVGGLEYTARLAGTHERIRMNFDSPQGPFSLTVTQLPEG